MGVTRLKRKARRNKQTAAKRQNSIKQLNSQPVIKNIDKEAIVASFGTAPAKEDAPAPASEAKEEAPKVVAETPAVEAPVAEAEEAPAAEEAAPEVEETPAEEEAPAEEASDEAAEEEKEA